MHCVLCECVCGVSWYRQGENGEERVGNGGGRGCGMKDEDG